MKIYKSNTNQIFDTESNFVKNKKLNTIELTPLHQYNKDETDFQFLKRNFSVNHSIFNDFRNSFYYVIK